VVVTAAQVAAEVGEKDLELVLQPALSALAVSGSAAGSAPACRLR
jgi:hypothetical protein